MSNIGDLLGKDKFNHHQINEKVAYTPKINLPKELEFESQDEELKNTLEYQKVMGIINGLWQGGTIKRAPGYCLSVSDMMLKLLNTQGVKSRLAECSVTVITQDPPTISMIGHDGVKTGMKDEMDNHIVVITDTEIPMLIDLSVFHFSELTNKPFIVERLSPSETCNLSEYTFENSRWMYEEKLDSKVPYLHQQSILDRINLDKKVEKNFGLVNKILIVLSIITSLNFIRGGADFYFKYVVRDNGFGPHQVHQPK